MDNYICPFMSSSEKKTGCIEACKFFSKGLQSNCLIKDTLEVLFMNHDDLNDIRIALEEKN